MTPRTVLVPGNGTSSLSFTIPANVDFNVESVVASVDASAAGDTIGELSIAEVTGEVIATKRQGLPITAGSSGTETWALRLDDEAAGSSAGFANCAYAVVSNTGSLTAGGASVTVPILANFDTNAPTVFAQDSSGGSPHVGGILLTAAGRYFAWGYARFLDPAGGAVEPAASWMFCQVTSFNYNGSQSDWHLDRSSQQGTALNFAATTFFWEPWHTDLQDLGAAFVGPPYSDYALSLYNAGTQTMNYQIALQVVRLGEASGL